MDHMDCRHQHRMSVTLQARPLTTLPASVLYTVGLGNIEHCRAQLASRPAVCRIEEHGGIVDETEISNDKVVADRK